MRAASQVRNRWAAPTDASWPQPFPYTHDPDKAKALLRDAGLLPLLVPTELGGHGEPYRTGLEVVRIEQVNLFGLWRLIEMRRTS